MLFSVLLSCSNTELQKTNALYFDSPSFFKSEIDRLENLDPKVLKRIESKAGIEEQKIRIEDYEKELSVFSKIDLNISAYYNMFSVDSVYREDTLIVEYKAKEKSLGLREYRLVVVDGNPQMISASSKTANALSDSGLKLIYQPSKGYKISKSGNSKVSDSFDFKISVEFLN
ncbi:MAG: hypothetical protein HKN22_06440 [Bacteroidia bacterium]|nr:hypothetical protein [Bacteroidia bacterium]